MNIWIERILGIMGCMVVVTFFGLAAIGNYMVRTGFSEGLRAKAKQSEAKLYLSSVYVAEKAHWAEFETFVPDLETVGFVPSGEMHYVVGFNPDCQRGKAQSRAPSSVELETLKPELAEEFSTAEETRLESGKIREIFRSFRECPKPDEGFLAIAVGPHPGDEDSFDVWTIDQNKKLVNHKPVPRR
ncbi:MAG: hypothetical protein ABL958_05060 [Bdellovibrionia bacterium]